MMFGFDAKHTNNHTTQRATGASASCANNTVTLGVGIALAVSIFICALALLTLGRLNVLHGVVLTISLLSITILGVVLSKPLFFRAQAHIA